MGLQADITSYIQQVNNDISTETDPNSIDPSMVGGIGIDLANLLLPYLLQINALNITGGAAAPTGGQENDVYFRGLLNSIQIYRNVAGNWVPGNSIPIGISYPNGILAGLRTLISGYILTVTPGSWAINNTAYSKGTQTQLTIAPTDLNFSRWDLIYADTNNDILMTTGVASSVPAKPALPANTILVDYIYVPVPGTPFSTGGTTSPTATNGVGKTKITVPDGSKVIDWQNDIVPNDTITYAAKHGNNIAEINGVYDAGGGAITPYSPNYTYTLNIDGSINILTITELFAGSIILY